MCTRPSSSSRDMGCELARAPRDLCVCGSGAEGLKTGVERGAVFLREFGGGESGSSCWGEGSRQREEGAPGRRGDWCLREDTAGLGPLGHDFSESQHRGHWAGKVVGLLATTWFPWTGQHEDHDNTVSLLFS